MQIVYYLIDGLQSDRRAVALTEIGVIITAHARKARNFWLDRLRTGPEHRYVSDGDPNTLTVPRKEAAEVDRTRLNGLSLRLY